MTSERSSELDRYRLVVMATNQCHGCFSGTFLPLKLDIAVFLFSRWNMSRSIKRPFVSNLSFSVCDVYHKLCSDGCFYQMAPRMRLTWSRASSYLSIMDMLWEWEINLLFRPLRSGDDLLLQRNLAILTDKNRKWN